MKKHIFLTDKIINGLLVAEIHLLKYCTTIADLAVDRQVANDSYGMARLNQPDGRRGLSYCCPENK